MVCVGGTDALPAPAPNRWSNNVPNSSNPTPLLPLPLPGSTVFLPPLPDLPPASDPQPPLDPPPSPRSPTVSRVRPLPSLSPPRLSVRENLGIRRGSSGSLLGLWSVKYFGGCWLRSPTREVVQHQSNESLWGIKSIGRIGTRSARIVAVERSTSITRVFEAP